MGPSSENRLDYPVIIKIHNFLPRLSGIINAICRSPWLTIPESKNQVCIVHHPLISLLHLLPGILPGADYGNSLGPVQDELVFSLGRLRPDGFLAIMRNCSNEWDVEFDSCQSKGLIKAESHAGDYLVRPKFGQGLTEELNDGKQGIIAITTENLWSMAGAGNNPGEGIVQSGPLFPLDN